jgi:very-short-patch-repair endonuclease
MFQHMDLTLERVRSLRRHQTAAEEGMLRQLRNRQLCGWKFRRQAPIDPYIADFLCAEARLVVELDGATHGTEEEIAHDARRTLYLERKGFTVFRVTNEAWRQDPDMVLHAIDRACTEALTRRSAG